MKNADDAYFVNYGNPWFVRGGHYFYGSNTGVFAFSNTNGHATNHSFRVVLNTIFKKIQK